MQKVTFDYTLINPTTIKAQCFSCRHFIYTGKKYDYRCRAFPGGIPKRILFNQVWHNKKYIGQDNNRVYAQSAAEVFKTKDRNLKDFLRS